MRVWLLFVYYQHSQHQKKTSAAKLNSTPNQPPSDAQTPDLSENFNNSERLKQTPAY